MKHLGRSLVIASVVFSFSPLAWADPTSQDRVAAETLFRDGKDLASQGKIAEACPKFAESERLDPKVGTQVYLATCHEQQGKTASAWMEFNEAANQASRAHQPDREKLARDHVAALEQKLSRMAITVASAPPGMQVKLDGEVLGQAALGTSMPMDPGDHTINVTAPNKKPYARTLTLPAGPTMLAVDIALEDQAPAAVAPPVAQKPAPAPVVVEGGSGTRTLGYAVGVVGLVGLGVGSYFGIHAASQKSDADKLCSGMYCSQAGLDQQSDASASARISTIAFGVGIVGVAAGVVLILVAHPSTPKATEHALIMPRVGGIGGVF
jgi:hypothetical protein